MSVELRLIESDKSFAKITTKNPIQDHWFSGRVSIRPGVGRRPATFKEWGLFFWNADLFLWDHIPVFKTLILIALLT